MKTSFLISIGMALVIGSTTSFAGTADPGVNKRQNNQQQRIKRGAISGSLTGGEVIRLEREQANIRKQERRFKSDGELTKRERVTLHRSLNRANRHIYKQKHDPQQQ